MKDLSSKPVTLSIGDRVRIREDADIDLITLKSACLTAWNDDTVEIDLRGHIGEVTRSRTGLLDGWVCMIVTIAGCIKVRTYQRKESLVQECVEPELAFRRGTGGGK